MHHHFEATVFHGLCGGTVVEQIEPAETVDLAMQGNGWGKIMPEFGDILWPNEEATFLELISQKSPFYEEMREFLAKISADRGFHVSKELADDLLMYQQHSIVDPWTPKSHSFNLRYNLHEYFHGAGQVGQSPMVKNPLSITATADIVFGGDLEAYAQQVVWYGRKGGSLRYSRFEACSPSNP